MGMESVGRSRHCPLGSMVRMVKGGNLHGEDEEGRSWKYTVQEMSPKKVTIPLSYL